MLPENVGLFSGKQPGEHNRTLAPDAPRVDAGNGPHTGIDHRVGVDGAQSAHGAMHGGQGHNDGPTQFDPKSPTHMDEHTPVHHEDHAIGHTPDFKSKLHGDEHLPVAQRAARLLKLLLIILINKSLIHRSVIDVSVICIA